MHLSSFSVRNYRSFDQQTTIALKPITLFFGYNNSGKSALLRFLPLIAESATGRWLGHLALDSPPAREAAFSDLCSRQSDDERFNFSLRGTLPSGIVAECNFDLATLPGTRHFVAGFEISASDPLLGSPTSLFAQWTGTEVPAATLTQEMAFECDGAAVASGPFPVSFRGLTPVLEGFEHPLPQQPLLDTLKTFLTELESSIQWLGAFRAPLRRRVARSRTGLPPRRLACDGTGAAELLAFDHDHGRRLIERVETWFRGNDSAPEHRLHVRPEADAVRLQLSPWQAPGVEVDMIDAGEGITQVLPVLVALARAERCAPGDPRIVAVEQPELHLHPRREIALARYIAEIAGNPDPPTIILETHSESLLLALQLEIVAGRLDPAKLGIYWIRQMETGSSVAQPLAVDAMARIDGWPRGVFEEDTELARRLVSERIRKEEA